jgi:hypothetical protein
MTYFKYLADLEPVEVCMMIGTCMDTVMDRLQVSSKYMVLSLDLCAAAAVYSSSSPLKSWF